MERLNEKILRGLGIQTGQERERPHFINLYNVGFYDLDGKKIGWGDLSKIDVQVLINHLPEPMLILGEQASHWDNVSWMSFRNGEGKDHDLQVVNEAFEANPGKEYVFQNLFMIIVPKKFNQEKSGLFVMASNLWDASETEIYEEDGFKYFLVPQIRKKHLLQDLKVI